jgi:hypothetical protein
VNTSAIYIPIYIPQQSEIFCPSSILKYASPSSNYAISYYENSLYVFCDMDIRNILFQH